MNDDRYVAAIEISSSKIIAAAGIMRADGRLDIIASDQERGTESVRYGIIQNLEETSRRLTRVIDRLQMKSSVAPRVITSLYVGLGGRSLRNVRTEVEISLPDESEITDAILARLRELALDTAIDSSLEVVDAIPRVYYIGKTETLSPKGAVGNSIRAVYDLIVCRPELCRNMKRTIEDKAGIHINGFLVTALSTAQVVLTTEEKRLGCMLVDMGAETTTVSIYKNGSLRYLATLPLGGRNITRDIESQSLLTERAEEIKITRGNAIASQTVSLRNMNGISMDEINNLIVARSEEIVANIVEQLKYAGFKEKDLPVGVICIGGGAKLNGMLELLGSQIDMNVREGKLPGYIHLSDAKLSSSDLVSVASLLYSGANSSEAECFEIPGSEALPVTGEGNEDAYDSDEDDETTRPKHRNRKKTTNTFWDNLRKRISEMYKSPETDNSDLLE